MEHNIYDKTLKELFSRPEIVKNFMQGFVGEEFVNDIDFNRIEKKNTSYITKTCQRPPPEGWGLAKQVPR